MRFFIIVIFFYSLLPVKAIGKADSLLKELDLAIVSEDLYTQQKKNTLNKLRLQLHRPMISEQERYDVYLNLALEYETFICDSAIVYAARSLELAQKINNVSSVNDSKLQLSRNEAKAGFFSKALEILHTLDTNSFSPPQLVEYYRTLTDVYIYLIEYHNGYDLHDLISNRDRYRDLLLQVVEPRTLEYAINYGFRYIENRQYQEAEKVLLDYLPFVEINTKEHARITSVLSHLYHEMGDMNREKEYLIYSALSDIRAAVKENISLRTLATLLFKEGNLTMANSFVKKSLSDANFYNGRLRNIQTAQVLPIIDEAYQRDRERQQNNLKLLLVVVSFLSIVLIIGFTLIVVQVKKLRKAKQYISEANAQLKALNSSLQQANERQKQSNLSLVESNYVKELFIKNFLEICTEHIEKLNDFKNLVVRKLKAGQGTDLLTIATKTDTTIEQRELYANFDRAFLSIYPTFIAEINALLREEERYPINHDHSLNQELRIFALIRLGIRDTNKLATFLRYTTRTVYNYRSKVKSKALDAVEDFEEQIKFICADLTKE